jgi:hypothetical protein
LIAGFIDDGLMDLTSLVCEKIIMHDGTGEWNEKKYPVDEFWKYLEDQNRNKSLMGCSAGGPTGQMVKDSEGATGIMMGHAYGINGVLEIEKQESAMREGKRS